MVPGSRSAPAGRLTPEVQRSAPHDPRPGRGLAESAELLAFQIGGWEHLGYPENVPPLGQRSADAIRAGHAAVSTIDEMIRDLQDLRGQLVSELRQDADIRGQRIDQMIAELGGPQ